MKRYFFCGIGGSGMLPLAMIVKGKGFAVAGSDRSRDQGRNLEKFAYLEQQGVTLVPQDGAGLRPDDKALVVSSAIEDTIPEVRRAKELGVPIIKRAELLAELFDKSPVRVGIGGTSGKSTTTGMLAWILSESGRSPTVMNGANFLNFVSPETPFASALVGQGDVFVTECDESDGSIVLYHPTVGVLTNIALDHKPVEELKPVFTQFLNHSARQVLNIDNDAVAETAADYPETALTVGINNPGARIRAEHIAPTPTGITAKIVDRLTGEKVSLSLKVIGRHNVENALCAIGAAVLCGVSLSESCRILGAFSGVGRRLQTIEIKNNISVIDDFAHNPDKIRASLSALNEFPGRLLVMFQMHGYGPLKLMREELVQSFAAGLKPGDKLYMPEVLYMGGTADKSYTAEDFARECSHTGVDAVFIPNRADIGAALRQEARAGDRIVVMGARDDTLTDFAKSIVI